MTGKSRTPPSQQEFIALMAMMIALVALSIDGMLPALPQIGADLRVADANDVQLVVGMFFFGMAVGQLLVGPLSDCYGRKPVIYWGIALYFAGCVLSIVAWSFDSMLWARLLQGIGISAPRVVTIAIVRDQYEGRPMARIMSFVMAVFIIVPAIAPALGQAILWVAGWRAIFVCFLFVASVALVWFGLRQPETLMPARRHAFSVSLYWEGLRQTFGSPIPLGYTIGAGLINGAFIAYLSSAQQVFGDTYGRAQSFALYFAMLALAIGAASILNGRIVQRFGMVRLSLLALVVLVVASGACLLAQSWMSGTLPFGGFMVWAAISFSCCGIVFGNLNALAMQPLGHIAGFAAAAIGFGATLISVATGVYVARLFDGTATPLVAGFAVLGAAALATIVITERYRPAAGHEGGGAGLRS